MTIDKLNELGSDDKNSSLEEDSTEKVVVEKEFYPPLTAGTKIEDSFTKGG
jgi:hypothetical protein